MSFLRLRPLRLCVTGCTLVWSSAAWAAPPESPAPAKAPEAEPEVPGTPSTVPGTIPAPGEYVEPNEKAEGPEEPKSDRPRGRRSIIVPDLRPQAVHEDRAASVVTRRQMQERLPRSAPDALRYEPGVSVQQSGHGQASPYLRGLTGQQTLMMFDGIRLNTSTFRQGPNQYFFTVSNHSLQRIEVLRGSASTEFGSDALGGALLTTPIEPTFGERLEVHPRVLWNSRTADGELGGRGQLDISWNDRIGLIGGAGYRDIGMLRTSGPIIAPATGDPWKSPRFAADERTQLGTGFREFTSDARLVFKLDRNWKLTAGYYDYRQKDAPRTDKCPPDEAPDSTCLTYLDQFRTLAYVGADTNKGLAPWERLRFRVSFQKQHERRLLYRDNGIEDRPGGTENNGRDDVYTFGTTLNASTKRWQPSPAFGLGIDYGADAYYDIIESIAWLRFTDTATPVVDVLSRGQYLDDARYLTSGAWTRLELQLYKRVKLRGGARLAYSFARALGEPESQSKTVNKDWVTPVGNVGITGLPTAWLSIFANYDQGFRAPNLDDLTSRQQTGPGFQFENADLDPERSHSLEGGMRIRHPWIELNGSVFHTWIDNLVGRKLVELEDCPSTEGGPGGCTASRTRLQVVNLEGNAIIYGVDGGIRLFLPHGIGVATSFAWAIGHGANPDPPDETENAPFEKRIPISRIPPINGTIELTWKHETGIWLGSALRWAGLQDRLANTDIADVRIPDGGTPGYAVVDMRAGYRWDPRLLVGLVFENVLDSAYRVHGSSVNGAERSLNVRIEVAY